MNDVESTGVETVVPGSATVPVDVVGRAASGSWVPLTTAVESEPERSPEPDRAAGRRRTPTVIRLPSTVPITDTATRWPLLVSSSFQNARTLSIIGEVLHEVRCS